MSVIKQKRGWMLAVVGDQQGGWSPAGGVVGGAIHKAVFNFRIESNHGGHLLVYASQDGALYGDTWHETLAEAEEVALEEFGIPLSAWEPDGDAGQHGVERDGRLRARALTPNRSGAGGAGVAKRKVPSPRDWFDNCGGWSSRHDVNELRRGIEAGLLNEQDEYGMTALHLAVSSGWLEGIEELLRAGADTESRYFRTGETPLLTAANDLGTANGETLNSKAMVAALVAAGANPDAANHFGLTPRKSAQIRGAKSFADIPENRVEMPEPRIQNAEHLADHYHPRFRIPDREERETMKVGQAVDLYIYGPKAEGKQDTVKVRITARSGSRSLVRYTATVETPIERTHLAPGTTEVEFRPENIASVYMARPGK